VAQHGRSIAHSICSARSTLKIALSGRTRKNYKPN
jgi:hypothetical protein